MFFWHVCSYRWYNWADFGHFAINHHGSFLSQPKVRVTLASDWTRRSTPRPPPAPCGLSLLSALLLPATQTRPSQSAAFVLFTYVRRQLELLSNMSATSVFPMCVRASRGLLRLRSGAVGASSPTVVDIVRTLSTDKPPAGTGSATGGLAQAILQERLQQQQQSQVRKLARVCALDLCSVPAASDVGGESEHTAARGLDVNPAHMSCPSQSNRSHFCDIPPSGCPES